MLFRYTKHAVYKFDLLKKYRFLISKSLIESIIIKPTKLETKPDGTYVAMARYDRTHVLRVVYRIEHDTMVIITFYPGRKKSYEI